MRSVRNYVREGSGSEERTDRLVTLLAAGLEQFPRCRRTSEGSGREPVDFPPDLSVTTDCRSDGYVEEN
jgi:hypothetical protein